MHVGIVGVQAYRNAPNLDEVAHLPAGLSHLEYGNFDLYRVNPPLVRMWAATPLIFLQPEIDWSKYHDSSLSRSEFDVGRQFLQNNGSQSFEYFVFARWMLIPVSVLGALVCYKWSAELFGSLSGVISATLWCFCPNIIAWGASITPDAAASAFGILATWRFWKWLREPSWGNVGLAGLGLGLAVLVKSTWIVLFVLWPVAWAVWRWFERGSIASKPGGAQLATVLITGIYLLNLGYGFENSFLTLSKFNFVSESLGGAGAHESEGNRFKESWLGRIPVPVPANYLKGIDVQKYEFEVGKWSYLRGEQKEGGWWYYYAYAILVKTPLGFLALIGLAACLCVFNREYRLGWANELILITPAVYVFVLVSSQTGFNRYLRYVLPVYPFLYIFASRVAVRFGSRGRLFQCTVILLLVSGIIP